MSLAILMLAAGCSTGGQSDGLIDAGIHSDHALLVLGPAGVGKITATGNRARGAIQWSVSPPNLAQARSLQDVPLGGWATGWYGTAEIQTRDILGNGTVDISIQSDQGPRTLKVALYVVSSIRVESEIRTEPLTAGEVFHPILKVTSPPSGNNGVPQDLVWEKVLPFPGGDLVPSGQAWGPYYVIATAPSAPGTYRLRATSTADPRASGTYEFRVR